MMQAQIVAAQSLSETQSLTCVHTLLKAGIGCITFLRGLLPLENFSEYHLASEANGALSSRPSDSFSKEDRQTRHISGVSIMNLNRGFTNEGDKIMDYLEHGIFDALQKRYLRSFIFAIYLDNKDPNNIVEAYTFNFDYHTLPGTDTVIPIMSLGEDLAKMSLKRTSSSTDPATEAMRQGKAPTLGEVKRSLKMMIRTLCTAMTSMDYLPKCRYGNFKLFYNVNAPDDYEPPNFRKGDTEKDKWFFSTHGKNESPEKCSMGRFETGWHGVEMTVVSVSSYLPSITEDNNAVFAGITPNSAPMLTPVEEARIRAQDIELQEQDALSRNVVWDAELDADGEEDKEVPGETETLVTWSPTNGCTVPIGIRNEDGSIQPLNVEESGPKATVKVSAQYAGKSEPTPGRVADLNDHVLAMEVDKTQRLPDTQECETNLPRDSIHTSPISRMSLPSSDMAEELQSIRSSEEVDTQRLKDMMGLGSCATPDSEMLDMETQQTFGPAHYELESAKAPSAIDLTTSPDVDGFDARPKSLSRLKNRGSNIDADCGRLECECGIFMEDDSCFCEGGCQRWYHVWCMGYHSTRDIRLPAKFICYDCRLRLRRDWDLLGGKIHDDMISRYKDLALFRRAIKTCEIWNPSSISDLKQKIGCNIMLASQLMNRLQTEGFVATESLVKDDLGIVAVRSIAKQTHKKGTKGKQKSQKELHKTKYIFLYSSTKSKAYFDYFNPDSDVENRVMGVGRPGGLITPQIDINQENSFVADGPSARQTPSKEPLSAVNHEDSQTQEDTQDIHAWTLKQRAAVELKRKLAMPENTTNKKKIKVSVATGVDLCD